MEKRFCLFILVLNIICMVFVTSRPFASNGDHVHSSIDKNVPLKADEGSGNESSVAKLEEVRKMGSSPPSCEHKCYGCMPCEAIQVPTTSSHVGVQYTNYEPEGWKCKCGPAFYSP